LTLLSPRRLETEKLQEGRHEIHESHKASKPDSPPAVASGTRKPDHQRYPQNLLMETLVEIATVILELLPMIGDEHDHGVL
jgi:hypothetical protein